MSQAITIHLPDTQARQLARLANRLGSSQDELGARFIDEALRMTDNALIEFRAATTGRHAYIRGSTLAVWEVIMLVRERRNDVAAVAAYLGWPITRVQAALSYAQAYPDEIDAALAHNASFDANVIRRNFPDAHIIDINVSNENADDDASSTVG